MSNVADYELTIMPLDYFRRLMGVDPYHFWQMTYTGHPSHGYSHVYPHERWQYAGTDMPGRAAKRGPGRLDILQAIADAEAKIASIAELDTWPGVMYTENEEVRLVTPRQLLLGRRSAFSIATRWRHVQAVGKRTYTPLAAGEVLVYDASDDVTCTFTMASAPVAAEIVVCYEGTTTQIRPISVIVTSGAPLDTVTITLKKWLCAKPEMWDTGSDIDATDAVANLMAAVDVYQLWYNPSEQITVAWEPDISACGCLGEDCEICQMATRTACALRKDYRVGVVGWQMAQYDVDKAKYVGGVSWPYTRFPDIVYISYTHGFPSGTCRYMSSTWQRVVAYLAAAMLPADVVDTTSIPDAMYYWRQDLAQPDEFGTHHLSMSDLGNPFGTMRGQIHAWNAVKAAVGD